MAVTVSEDHAWSPDSHAMPLDVLSMAILSTDWSAYLELA